MPSPGRTSCEIRDLFGAPPIATRVPARPRRSRRAEPRILETDRDDADPPATDDSPRPDGAPAAGAPRITGMACRTCGQAQPLGLFYVCPACFGPLEVTYDLAVGGCHVHKRGDRRPCPGHLALPGAASGRRRAGRSLPVGSTPLLDRRPARPGPRRRAAVAQGRHPQPVAVVQGSRRRRSPRSARSSSASRPSPARRPATWPAPRPPPRRPSACRPTCSSRPTSSPPRSTMRSPTARRSSRSTGTYDDVNRLCLEVADETGWGFVNINLRPFYAEGSKTLAYEIAESLGWRTPDVVVAPVASGRCSPASRAASRSSRSSASSSAGRSASSAARPPAAPRSRRPSGRRHGRHRARPRAGHHRALAGDRQPRRRTLRRRARARAAVDPSRPSPTRRRPPRSATWRDSRASTRRRPAA